MLKQNRAKHRLSEIKELEKEKIIVKEGRHCSELPPDTINTIAEKVNAHFSTDVTGLD